MFGSKRPEPLRLVPFAETRPLTFCHLLCDGVTAHNLSSFAELMTVHARLQEERPEVFVLATLDDLDQACYTCGHATDLFALDDPGAGDPPRLADDLDDQEEQEEEPDFSNRLANLLSKARSVDVAQLAGLLEFAPDAFANDFVAVNKDPDGALRLAAEREILFQFVPVAAAADAVAAFPNGYFSSDLNPMQTRALAARLEAAYGLALFGIGSRYLAFRSRDALAADMARTLAAELASLYSGTPTGAAVELAHLLAGRDWLLLRYTES